MAKAKLLICPYCGDPQPERERCRACGGLFEPLSRRATHNAMGPWFIRDPKRPFQPGCSYDTLVQLIHRGKVDKLTIVRGPTTRQFWTIAKRVPGIAHLFGYCHDCGASVDAVDHGCHACGVAFGAYLDRNYLGLPEFRPMPWETDAEDRSDGIIGAASPPPLMPVNLPGGRSSRFATDEELFGGGLTPAEAEENRVAAEAGEVAVAVQTQEEDQAAARMPWGSGAALSAMERSLRRTVDHQQRVIRRLAVAGAVVGVALIALLIFRIPVGAPPAGTTVPEGPPRAAAPGPPAGQLGNVVPEPQAPILEEPALDEGPPIDDWTDEENEEETDIEIDVEAAFAQALALLEAADDEGRALADRISDCEQALAILNRIDRHAAPEDRPQHLDAAIELARRQCDRLRLREFFP